MTKWLLLATGTLMVAASLVGCGDPITGEVVGFTYQPGRADRERYCVQRNLKTQGCVVYRTRSTREDPTWDLALRTDDGDIATVRVDSEDFEDCPIGVRYPECTEG